MHSDNELKISLMFSNVFHQSEHYKHFHDTVSVYFPNKPFLCASFCFMVSRCIWNRVNKTI